LFIGVVVFAPNGIAGLVMRHEPLWQARAYGSLLRLALAYLIALGPALLLVAGLIVVIEMSYHLSVKASEGPTISVFHLTLNTVSVWPWLGTAVLVVGGYLLFRRTWPIVDAAWHNALVAAQRAGKAK
jgi:branched-chain amino acid transport system permease protein